MSRAVIDEYEAKVAELQIDIEKLRKQADQLEAQQKKYRRKIRKERVFISPARRLPPEILILIFSFRVDNELSYNLAIPMRVCKIWYSVVVSCCARLWSYVRLDGFTRSQWWNGALGTPTVPMPSTAPVMGYLRACTTHSREVPLTICIYLDDFAQSLGAGPYDSNAMNVIRCLNMLIGENGKYLPRWQSLALFAGQRVNLDEDLLQIFYQDMPNLEFLHLHNFSDLAFPRFKSLPSLVSYSRGGCSGSHDINSIPKDDRGTVKCLQTFVTVQEWIPNDYRFCQAFQNIISLSLINPRSSHVLCRDVTGLSFPHLERFYLEGPFDHVFLSELHLPKLVSFFICANNAGKDSLEDIFVAKMEVPCAYVVWRRDQGKLGKQGLRQRVTRLFESFKAIQRLDLEPWVEPIIPPVEIHEIMQETGAWIGREESMLITYCAEQMYLLSPPAH